MSKKSDDSIERIFRQALTQYDAIFREHDWLKMEKMLNEEAARRAAARSYRNKGIAFTLLGLTGLIIAVYFLVFNNPSESIGRLNDSITGLQASGDFNENENVTKENSSDALLSKSTSADSSASKNDLKEIGSNGEQKLKSDSSLKQRKDMRSIIVTPYLKDDDKNYDARNNVPKIKEREEGNITNKTSVTNSLPANDEAKTRDRIQRPLEGSLSQNELSPREISDAGEFQLGEIKNDVESKRNKMQSVHTKEADIVLSPETSGKIKPKDKQFIPRDKVNSVQEPEQSEHVKKSSMANQINEIAFDEIIPSNQSVSESPAGSNASVTNNDSLSNELSLIQKEERDSLEKSLTNLEKKEQKNPVYRWNIGVIFAPEFSTTSLNRYSTPGEAFGLRIGYRISNRFTINTGFIRSDKKYVDDGNNYKLQYPEYWQYRTNGVIPEEIDGRCLVYELPIGIQFDAIQTHKSRLFLSASLSSYFMASQSYEYQFDSPNPGADTGWKSAESEKYWFKVGEISAGYERYIYPALAIGIEPYLKISLSEIGWPNVKLFSTGAYLTIRYRFKTKNIFTE